MTPFNLLLMLCAALPPGDEQPVAKGTTDLSSWRPPHGEWSVGAAATLHPEDERRLASQSGAGVIVNGEQGRTRNLLTVHEHGDVMAHIEFMVPRGSNSGVYFMGRYEIQVLDSFGVEQPKHSDCGGIYQRWEPQRGQGKQGYEGHPPTSNASRAPGEWQSFDVLFRAPRFDANGSKTENARFIRVVHNGTLVHENVQLTGPTRAASFPDEQAAGPLMLQGDHGPVAYRNIRLRPLEIGADGFPRERFGETGFESIFDGATLSGWHVSGRSGHSRASGNQSGGRWVVEDGAIVGSQDTPGNGGIVITDAAYRDFEVALEMNNDFVPDSGLFLRSTENGVAYQCMIDYHSRGNLLGLYGEGMKRGFHVRNFSFVETPEEIVAVEPGKVPFALPVTPEDWPRFWKHGEWNELRARIQGNPPTITTWINGVRFMEFTDTEMRHQGEGGIALQVHGGGDHTREFVRYRNIRVKVLSGSDPAGSRSDG